MKTTFYILIILSGLFSGCWNKPGKTRQDIQDINQVENAGEIQIDLPPVEINILDRAWLLLEMDELDPEVRRQIWIRFDSGEPFRFVGYSSCNRFFGTYDMNGHNLVMSDIASTKKMCPGIKVEDLFLERLDSIRRFEIEEDRLILLDDRGQRLVFEETELDQVER